MIPIGIWHKLLHSPNEYEPIFLIMLFYLERYCFIIGTSWNCGIASRTIARR